MNSPKYIKLVGTPYSKLDCYGVVKEFYMLEFGIKLKDYYTDGPKEANAANALIWSSVGDFKLVDEPKFGDILLIKLNGIECHIAVYLGEGLILHSRQKTDCVIERFHYYRRSVAGIYRVVHD